MGVLGIAMFVLSLSLAVPFAHLFGHGEQELINLIIRAAIIYSFAYLALGYSMFTSAFFTALNNGAVSTIISLCRTLIFQIGFAFLFPILFGDQSLWWALTAGELINVGLGTIFLILNRKKYGY